MPTTLNTNCPLCGLRYHRCLAAHRNTALTLR